MGLMEDIINSKGTDKALEVTQTKQAQDMDEFAKAQKTKPKTSVDFFYDLNIKRDETIHKLDSNKEYQQDTLALDKSALDQKAHLSANTARDNLNLDLQLADYKRTLENEQNLSKMTLEEFNNRNDVSLLKAQQQVGNQKIDNALNQQLQENQINYNTGLAKINLQYNKAMKDLEYSNQIAMDRFNNTMNAIKQGYKVGEQQIRDLTNQAYKSSYDLAATAYHQTIKPFIMYQSDDNILQDIGSAGMNLLDAVVRLGSELVNAGYALGTGFQGSLDTQTAIYNWLGMNPIKSSDLTAGDYNVITRFTPSLFVSAVIDTLPEMTLIGKAHSLIRGANFADVATAKFHNGLARMLGNTKMTANLNAILANSNKFKMSSANVIKGLAAAEAMAAISWKHAGAGLGLFGLDTFRRIVNLRDSRDRNDSISFEDFQYGIFHSLIDYASGGFILNKYKNAAEDVSMYYKALMSGSTKSLKKNIGANLAGNAVSGFAFEGLSEVIQTYFELDAQSGYKLPFISDLIFDTTSKYEREKNLLGEAGLLGGLIGAGFKGSIGALQDRSFNSNLAKMNDKVPQTNSPFSDGLTNSSKLRQDINGILDNVEGVDKGEVNQTIIPITQDIAKEENNITAGLKLAGQDSNPTAFTLMGDKEKEELDGIYNEKKNRQEQIGKELTEASQNGDVAKVKSLTEENNKLEEDFKTLDKAKKAVDRRTALVKKAQLFTMFKLLEAKYGIKPNEATKKFLDLVNEELIEETDTTSDKSKLKQNAKARELDEAFSEVLKSLDVKQKEELVKTVSNKMLERGETKSSITHDNQSSTNQKPTLVQRAKELGGKVVTRVVGQRGKKKKDEDTKEEKKDEQTKPTEQQTTEEVKDNKDTQPETKETTTEQTEETNTEETNNTTQETIKEEERVIEPDTITDEEFKSAINEVLTDNTDKKNEYLDSLIDSMDRQLQQMAILNLINKQLYHQYADEKVTITFDDVITPEKYSGRQLNQPKYTSTEARKGRMDLLRYSLSKVSLINKYILTQDKNGNFQISEVDANAFRNQVISPLNKNIDRYKSIMSQLNSLITQLNKSTTKEQRDNITKTINSISKELANILNTFKNQRYNLLHIVATASNRETIFKAAQMVQSISKTLQDVKNDMEKIFSRTQDLSLSFDLDLSSDFGFDLMNIIKKELGVVNENGKVRDISLEEWFNEAKTKTELNDRKTKLKSLLSKLKYPFMKLYKAQSDLFESVLEMYDNTSNYLTDYLNTIATPELMKINNNLKLSSLGINYPINTIANLQRLQPLFSYLNIDHSYLFDKFLETLQTIYIDNKTDGAIKNTFSLAPILDLLDASNKTFNFTINFTDNDGNEQKFNLSLKPSQIFAPQILMSDTKSITENKSLQAILKEMYKTNKYKEYIIHSPNTGNYYFNQSIGPATNKAFKTIFKPEMESAKNFATYGLETHQEALQNVIYDAFSKVQPLMMGIVASYTNSIIQGNKLEDGTDLDNTIDSNNINHTGFNQKVIDNVMRMLGRDSKTEIPIHQINQEKRMLAALIEPVRRTFQDLEYTTTDGTMSSNFKPFTYFKNKDNTGKERNGIQVDKSVRNDLKRKFGNMLQNLVTDNTYFKGISNTRHNTAKQPNHVKVQSNIGYKFNLHRTQQALAYGILGRHISKVDDIQDYFEDIKNEISYSEWNEQIENMKTSPSLREKWVNELKEYNPKKGKTISRENPLQYIRVPKVDEKGNITNKLVKFNVDKATKKSPKALEGYLTQIELTEDKYNDFINKSNITNESKTEGYVGKVVSNMDYIGAVLYAINNALGKEGYVNDIVDFNKVLYFNHDTIRNGRVMNENPYFAQNNPYMRFNHDYTGKTYIFGKTHKEAANLWFSNKKDLKAHQIGILLAVGQIFDLEPKNLTKIGDKDNNYITLLKELDFSKMPNYLKQIFKNFGKDLLIYKGDKTYLDIKKLLDFMFKNLSNPTNLSTNALQNIISHIGKELMPTEIRKHSALAINNLNVLTDFLKTGRFVSSNLLVYYDGSATGSTESTMHTKMPEEVMDVLNVYHPSNTIMPLNKFIEDNAQGKAKEDIYTKTLETMKNTSKAIALIDSEGAYSGKGNFIAFLIGASNFFDRDLIKKFINPTTYGSSINSLLKIDSELPNTILHKLARANEGILRELEKRIKANPTMTLEQIVEELNKIIDSFIDGNNTEFRPLNQVLKAIYFGEENNSSDFGLFKEIQINKDNKSTKAEAVSLTRGLTLKKFLNDKLLTNNNLFDEKKLADTTEDIVNYKAFGEYLTNIFTKELNNFSHLFTKFSVSDKTSLENLSRKNIEKISDILELNNNIPSKKYNDLRLVLGVFNRNKDKKYFWNLLTSQPSEIKLEGVTEDSPLEEQLRAFLKLALKDKELINRLQIKDNKDDLSVNTLRDALTTLLEVFEKTKTSDIDLNGIVLTSLVPFAHNAMQYAYRIMESQHLTSSIFSTQSELMMTDFLKVFNQIFSTLVSRKSGITTEIKGIDQVPYELQSVLPYAFETALEVYFKSLNSNTILKIFDDVLERNGVKITSTSKQSMDEKALRAKNLKNFLVNNMNMNTIYAERLTKVKNIANVIMNDNTLDLKTKKEQINTSAISIMSEYFQNVVPLLNHFVEGYINGEIMSEGQSVSQVFDAFISNASVAYNGMTTWNNMLTETQTMNQYSNFFKSLEDAHMKSINQLLDSDEIAKVIHTDINLQKKLEPTTQNSIRSKMLSNRNDDNYINKEYQRLYKTLLYMTLFAQDNAIFTNNIKLPFYEVSQEAIDKNVEKVRENYKKMFQQYLKDFHKLYNSFTPNKRFNVANIDNVNFGDLKKHLETINNLLNDDIFKESNYQILNDIRKSIYTNDGYDSIVNSKVIENIRDIDLANIPNDTIELYNRDDYLNAKNDTKQSLYEQLKQMNSFTKEDIIGNNQTSPIAKALYNLPDSELRMYERAYTIDLNNLIDEIEKSYYDREIHGDTNIKSFNILSQLNSKLNTNETDLDSLIKTLIIDKILDKYSNTDKNKTIKLNKNTRVTITDLQNTLQELFNNKTSKILIDGFDINTAVNVVLQEILDTQIDTNTSFRDLITNAKVKKGLSIVNLFDTHMINYDSFIETTAVKYDGTDGKIIPTTHFYNNIKKDKPSKPPNNKKKKNNTSTAKQKPTNEGEDIVESSIRDVEELAQTSAQNMRAEGLNETADLIEDITSNIKDNTQVIYHDADNASQGQFVYSLLEDTYKETPSMDSQEAVVNPHSKQTSEIHIFRNKDKATEAHEYIHAAIWFASVNPHVKARQYWSEITQMYFQVRNNIMKMSKDELSKIGLTEEIRDYIFNNNDGLNAGIHEFVATFLTEKPLFDYLNTLTFNKKEFKNNSNTKLGKAMGLARSLLSTIWNILTLAFEKDNLANPLIGQALIQTTKKLSEFNNHTKEAQRLERERKHPLNIANSLFKSSFVWATNGILLNAENYMARKGLDESYLTEVKADIKDLIDNHARRVIELNRNKADKPLWYRGASVLYTFLRIMVANPKIILNPVKREMYYEMLTDVKDQLVEGTFLDSIIQLDFKLTNNTFLKKASNAIQKIHNQNSVYNVESEQYALGSKNAVLSILDNHKNLKARLDYLDSQWDKKGKKPSDLFKESVGRVIAQLKVGDLGVTHSGDDVNLYHINQAMKHLFSHSSATVQKEIEKLLNGEENKVGIISMVTKAVENSIIPDINGNKLYKEDIEFIKNYFLNATKELGYTRISRMMGKNGFSNIEQIWYQFNMAWNKYLENSAYQDGVLKEDGEPRRGRLDSSSIQDIASTHQLGESQKFMAKALRDLTTLQTIYMMKQGSKDPDVAYINKHLQPLREIINNDTLSEELKKDTYSFLRDVTSMYQILLRNSRKNKTLKVNKALDAIREGANPFDPKLRNKLYLEGETYNQGKLDTLNNIFDIEDTAFYLDSYVPYGFNNEIDIKTIKKPRKYDEIGDDEIQKQVQYLLDKGYKLVEDGKHTMVFKYEGMIDYRNHLNRYGYIPSNEMASGIVTWADTTENPTSKGDAIMRRARLALETAETPFSYELDGEFRSQFINKGNKALGISNVATRERMDIQTFEKLIEPDLKIETLFYNLAKEEYGAKHDQIINDQVWNEILANTHDISKRKGNFKDKYGKNSLEFEKPHHAELLATRVTTEHKDTFAWNTKVLEKYGIKLNRKDINRLKNVILSRGEAVSDYSDGIYVDTRLLNMYFGYKNAMLPDTENGKLDKLIKGAQTFLRFFVKETRNNTIIRNPSLVIKNYTSNLLGLVAMGIPPSEVFNSQITYIKALEDYLADTKAYNTKKAQFNAYKTLSKSKKVMTPEDMKQASVLEVEIAMLEKRLNTNLMKPLFNEGLYTNIIEDAEEDTIQLDQKAIEKIKKVFNIKDDSTAEYMMNELGLTSKSELYNALARWNRYGDIIPRAILYYYDRGQGMSHEQAILDAQDTFINYNSPLYSSVLRNLDFYGMTNYLKYRVNVQRQIFKILKDKPVNTIGYLLADLGLNLDYASSFLSENIIMRGLPTGFLNPSQNTLMNGLRWNNMFNY